MWPTGGQAVLHDESNIVDDVPQLDTLAGYPSSPVLLPCGVARRRHVAEAEGQVKVTVLVEEIKLALVARHASRSRRHAKARPEAACRAHKGSFGTCPSRRSGESVPFPRGVNWDSSLSLS